MILFQFNYCDSLVILFQRRATNADSEIVESQKTRPSHKKHSHDKIRSTNYRKTIKMTSCDSWAPKLRLHSTWLVNHGSRLCSWTSPLHTLHLPLDRHRKNWNALQAKDPTQGSSPVPTSCALRLVLHFLDYLKILYGTATHELLKQAPAMRPLP